MPIWWHATPDNFPEPLCNLNLAKPESGNFFTSLRECCHSHQCVNGTNGAVSIATMCCEVMSLMSSSGGCEPSPVSQHTDSQFHYIVVQRDLHLRKPAPQNSVFWFDILWNIFTVYGMWVHNVVILKSEIFSLQNSKSIFALSPFPFLNKLINSLKKQNKNRQKKISPIICKWIIMPKSQWCQPVTSRNF